MKFYGGSHNDQSQHDINGTPLRSFYMYVKFSNYSFKLIFSKWFRNNRDPIQHME